MSMVNQCDRPYLAFTQHPTAHGEHVMNQADEMKGKVCLVTGGNTGIGRATATELAKRGATVVLLCRSPERGEEARAAIAAETGNPKVELLVCDLASLASVRKAAAAFLARHPRLDVLVNNAAIFAPARETTAEGLEKTFVTNYLSHFLLTNLLLERLKASAPSRIVNVASKTGNATLDFDDLQSLKGKFSFMTAVPRTKLSQVMFTRELARKLEGTGVTVNALHPGLVKTPLLDDMNGFMRMMIHLFSMPPEKGARTAVFLATSPDVAQVSGKLFEKNREVPLSGQVTEAAAAQRLWAESAQLAGLASAHGEAR
jgi:NAD(P)-dependent dehydrogenase (short-subunit alcohol dehydrogenase family)